MASAEKTNGNDAGPGEQPAPNGQRPQRVKKRIAIPTVFVLLLVVVAILVWIRGTWADAAPKYPKRSDEGIVTQLLQIDGNHKQVHCAVVVDRPLRDVWKAITDYDHFPQIFRHVSRAEATPQPDGGVQLEGAVSTIAGVWDFSARLKHEETPDACQVSWDDASGDLRVNRGSWTLQRLDDRRTLIVYALEIELQRYPSFLIRTALLAGTPDVVRSLQDWLAHASAEAP